MPSLSIPLPTVKFTDAMPSKLNLAVLEKPVEIYCGNVTFSNGEPFEQNQQKVAGYFIYRQKAGFVEIWDETPKQWKPDPGEILEALEPKPLAFKPDESEPWQGLFVPAGEKNPVFEKQDTTFKYFFRTYFVSNEQTGFISGLSAPSVAINFTGILDAMRAGIKLGENQKPEDATEIELFLRNESGRIIGSVAIFSEVDSARIEISNRDGTSSNQRGVIRLLSSGDIEIIPVPNRRVLMQGDLDVSRIFYQPANPVTGIPVGNKQWLG
ncbi:MAG: hypothetical protein VKN72_07440 [Nostocales cyanobacterium 94392]|nr:hypothetical protein [Nostocales cyanobacterium 94392]